MVAHSSSDRILRSCSSMVGLLPLDSLAEVDVLVEELGAVGRNS